MSIIAALLLGRRAAALLSGRRAAVRPTPATQPAQAVPVAQPVTRAVPADYRGFVPGPGELVESHTNPGYLTNGIPVSRAPRGYWRYGPPMSEWRDPSAPMEWRFVRVSHSGAVPPAPEPFRPPAVRITRRR